MYSPNDVSLWLWVRPSCIHLSFTIICPSRGNFFWKLLLYSNCNSKVPLTYFHKENAFICNSGLHYWLWMLFQDLETHSIILFTYLWACVFSCKQFLGKLNSNRLLSTMMSNFQRKFFMNRKDSTLWKSIITLRPVSWPISQPLINSVFLKGTETKC